MRHARRRIHSLSSPPPLGLSSRLLPARNPRLTCPPALLLLLAAATSVIWVKDPSEDSQGNHVGWVAILTTTVVSLLTLLTVLSMLQMFSRLHTPAPEMAQLHLKTGKGKSVANVPEFFVASEPPSMAPPMSGGGSSSYGGMAGGRPPDERSNLLCLDRGKG